MTRRAPPTARVIAALGVALGCGMPDPEALPRVVAAAPEGEAVSPGAVAEIRFEAPVDPDGLTDGRRLVLVHADALRAASTAVESDAGAVALEGAIESEIALDPGARRVELRPRAPLRPWTAHALVLSSRVRAADGRAVLDPEGRRRTFVRSFATGAPEGPPGVPVLTEVLVDAATPEAGGEYVEVLNVGEGPLDLAGWRLAKRSSSGTLSSCGISAPPGAVLAPGGVGLVGGGAWDGRYELQAGVPVLACGTTALLGGIANDRAPELLLADPTGAVVATLGAGGGPVCVAVERLAPRGADEPANLACTAGSPGVVPGP